MVWIDDEAVWFVGPAFDDCLIWREAAQSLQSLCEVVGLDEGVEVGSQLVMRVVVVSPDGCLFQGSVHALNLAIGPRVIWLGQTMFDAIFTTDAIEHVDAVLRGRAIAVLGHVAELNAVVGQHGVDFVGNSSDDVLKEGGSDLSVSLLVEFDDREFAHAIYGDEHIELAVAGSDLGDVDVEIANRIVFEPLLGFVALDGWQARDVVTLEQTVQ